MTLIDAPARPRPGRAGHPSPVSLGRLLWLELRRNAMPERVFRAGRLHVWLSDKRPGCACGSERLTFCGRWSRFGLCRFSLRA